MRNDVDQENAENSIDAYDQFFGAEVCLLNKWGIKRMTRVTKSLKNNKGDPRRIEHPTLFADHLLYDVSFLNGQTEDMKVNVIADNMLSQMNSKGHTTKY